MTKWNSMNLFNYVLVFDETINYGLWRLVVWSFSKLYTIDPKWIHLFSLLPAVSLSPNSSHWTHYTDTHTHTVIIHFVKWFTCYQMNGPIHDERNIWSATETSINFISRTVQISHSRICTHDWGDSVEGNHRWWQKKKKVERINKNRRTTEIVAPTDKLN